MSCAHLFDLEKLPAEGSRTIRPGHFRPAHAAWRGNLVENGAPFVMVANGMPWDSHVFTARDSPDARAGAGPRHLSISSPISKSAGCSTTRWSIAMGEFGRTPWLNHARGRDHYPNAWSLVLAGCGIKRGVVVGATDKRRRGRGGEAVQRTESLRDDLHRARASIPTRSTTCRICRRSTASKTRPSRFARCC